MKRFSILTDDLTTCIECREKGIIRKNINKHEIFYGRNRQNSIKYGLVIPLCQKEHHNQFQSKGIHFDVELCDKWHKRGQKAFEEKYKDLDFVSIFRKNYL